MPSRWVSGDQDLLVRLRNSPAAIAATAGGIGLICGALVMAVTSGPSATPSQVAQKPPVETTGVATPLKVEAVQAPAPVKSDTASAPDCARQTWPYITQQCLTEREAAQRKVRVITTDKIAPPIVNAIEQETKDAPRIKNAPVQKNGPVRETANLAPVETMRAAPAPAPIPVVAVAPTPAPETKAAPVINRPAPVAARVVTPTVAPTPSPAPVVAPMPAPKPQMAVTSEQPPQAATNEQPPITAANEKRTKSARDAHDKPTREAKSRRAPARDSDDDDVADYSPRTRIVDRWTEREYIVPSEQSSQRRRVIVIRRGGDQNPFGSLFSSAFR